MPIDKEFTYQIIENLRNRAKAKARDEFDRNLMLAAANVMEINIRAYLDLLENKRIVEPI